jgi:zeaxanthin glucosyltransferase
LTLLVISPDYASHAVPLITLAAAWHAAEEQVVVATGPAVAPLVEQSGMHFVQLSLGRGSNPGVARAERQPPGEDANLRAFFDATRRGMVATLRYQAEARAGDLLWQPVQTAQRTLEIVDALKPAEILVDHLAFGATIGLRAAGIPYADAVLGHPRQLPVAGETYGVPGAWPAVFEVDAQELASLRTLARSVSDRFTDDYNAALLKLSPSAAPVHDAFGAHGSVVLLNYPRELHDSRRTSELPTAHAFLGATPRAEQLSPHISDWLEQDAQRPLVLVALGTFLSARDDVLTVIAQGLHELDVRVALATGSSDPRDLGPLPSEWLVAPYLPQVGLLERASALITHAGNNSVTEAIAGAVPMLALPFSTDQFDGAAAIEKAGLGLAADPNRLGPHQLAEAVRELVGTSHPALDRLSAEIAARPSPEVARALTREGLSGSSSRAAGDSPTMLRSSDSVVT